MKTLKSLLAIFCTAILSFAFCGDALAGSASAGMGKQKRVVEGTLSGGNLYDGTVTDVTSGDRFTIRLEDKRISVKGKDGTIDCILWGVEAPDVKESEEGTKAKKELEKLILNKKVKISWEDPSCYKKRTLTRSSGNIYYPTYYLVEAYATIDGRPKQNVGLEMLKGGYAKHFSEETKDSKKMGVHKSYQSAEKKAQAQKSEN